MSLDKELIELWRKTALPADPVELDAELRRAGLVRILFQTSRSYHAAYHGPGRGLPSDDYGICDAIRVVGSAGHHR